MKVKENLFELDEAYKRGYAEGVYELRGKLLAEIEELLEYHEFNLPEYADDKNLQGWIECLQMFQHQLKGDEHE